MTRWTRFSPHAWVVRILLVAAAAVVISGVGGWLIGLPLLIFMAVLLRLAWAHIGGS